MENTVHTPEESAVTQPVSAGYFAMAWRSFRKNRLAMVSLIVFLLIVVACYGAPYICRYYYSDMNFDIVKQEPSWDHIFGTDMLGRDVLSRVLYGGQTTLRISFTAVFLSTVVGGIIGLAAGYWGGIFDDGIMRVMDAVSAIPTVLLSIVIEFALGFGVGNYQYAMAIALVPPLARLLRSAVMTIKTSEYIEAAKALGVGDGKIIFTHIIPNVAAPVLIHISNAAAESILMCTVLGYIGLGMAPPQTEWGELVASGYPALRTHPYISLLPCLVVVLCVLSLNLIGNGLRDSLDPSDR